MIKFNRFLRVHFYLTIFLAAMFLLPTGAFAGRFWGGISYGILGDTTSGRGADLVGSPGGAGKIGPFFTGRYSSNWYADLGAAATALNAMAPTVVFFTIDSSYSLTASVTFNKNVIVQPTPGHEVTFNSYNLAINNIGPTWRFKWANENGTGKLLLSGFVHLAFAHWWGWDTGASASVNSAAFESAFTSAYEGSPSILDTGSGIYTCDPVSYTKTSSTFDEGIRIIGGTVASSERGNAKTYIDCSHYTGTDKWFTFTNNNASGSVSGISFENLGLHGPGSVTANTTKGIFFEGDIATSKIGSMALTLDNVIIQQFNTGFEVTGNDNWPLKTNDLYLLSNYYGMNLNEVSTSGIHNNTVGSDNYYDVRLKACSNQAFFKPVMQSGMHANGSSFLILGSASRDPMDVQIIGPYFEGNLGHLVTVGYDTDGAASPSLSIASGSVRDLIITGGVWSHSGTTMFKVGVGRLDHPHLIGVRGLEDFKVGRIAHISKANPAVVTLNEDIGLSDGDLFYISQVWGMTEITTGMYMVDTPSGNQFNLHDINDSPIDSTTYSDFTYGGYVSQNDTWEGPFDSGIKTPSRHLSGYDRLNLGSASGLEYLRAGLGRLETGSFQVRGCMLGDLSFTEENQRYGYKMTVSTNNTELTDLSVLATWANAIPAGSMVLGVTARVTTTITSDTGTTWALGHNINTTPVPTDTDAWGSGLAFAAGTTVDGNGYTIAGPIYNGNTSAKDITLAPDTGSFTAGAVRLTIHYIDFTAPTF